MDSDRWVAVSWIDSCQKKEGLKVSDFQVPLVLSLARNEQLKATTWKE